MIVTIFLQHSDLRVNKTAVSEARDAAKLGEIKDQRLTAYGDQMERCHEQGADRCQREPPYTC